MKNFKKQFKSFVDKYLNNYNFVYLTTDLRGFIKTFPDIHPDEICDFIINTFIKKKITVIIPTYSYSNKGKFIIESTQSNLSYFTKWFLTKKIERSEHPIFSVASRGPKSKIVMNIGKSAFGYDSIFERLLKNKTSIFHLGRPFNYGNTITHYIEQSVGASYRHNKNISTSVYKKKKLIGKNYSIFARNSNLKDKKYITNSKKIDLILKKKKLITQIGNEKKLTNITHLDFKKIYHVMCNSFYNDNKIFIN
ncbi:MAG: Aminoglycoside N3'-acetyltransferase [Pelagibacterales bacterium]|nr:Aminoglycoside N3'-acetyltransferase [Pelagibacterales bacterium]|tara:strand:+ start:930 stop:1682 length:753 start_codon:yes stop_codon:yes gene_type:complete